MTMPVCACASLLHITYQQNTTGTLMSQHQLSPCLRSSITENGWTHRLVVLKISTWACPAKSTTKSWPVVCWCFCPCFCSNVCLLVSHCAAVGWTHDCPPLFASIPWLHSAKSLIVESLAFWLKPCGKQIAWLRSFVHMGTWCKNHLNATVLLLMNELMGQLIQRTWRAHKAHQWWWAISRSNSWSKTLEDFHMVTMLACCWPVPSGTCMWPHGQLLTWSIPSILGWLFTF